MTDHDPIDPDFADLPNAVRAEIEGLQGVGLHHAPIDPPTAGDGAPAAPAAAVGSDDAFAHPETDRAGTAWEPNWEPIDSYAGGVVMLDDGERQVLGMRDDGVWREFSNGDERDLAGYEPMLWSPAPDQVKYDLM